MDFLQLFKANKQKKFGNRPAPWLLAVSGGADSMTMAHLHLKAGISFAIAHCNYQLRGQDADKDEQLVTDWAKQHTIPCYTIRFDTQAKAAEWGKAIQETARILRYQWFETLCKTHGYNTIATAHHAGDNAETLLMNLLKGTGMNGLHGIPEINGRILRPLLFATPQQIRAYAAQEKVPFREDASNASDAYLRNAVRLHILSAIENIFPQALQRLKENTERFAQGAFLYQRAIMQEKKKLLEQRGTDYYTPIRLLEKHPAADALIYELFSPYGFSPAQMPQIKHLLQAESGRYLSSATHRLIRNREFLILTAQQTTATAIILIEQIPAEIDVQQGIFRFSDAPVADMAQLPGDPSIACIDLKKLSFPLILRRWRTGDYFYPLGMQMKKKKLSRFFMDQKLPVHLKEQVWVLESNRRIVWVAGMRLDERFKVTPSTTSRLVVQYQKG
jgi:tRNA(Ile)-lysidine synthase